MRVGIVGAGAMGAVHAAAWSATDADFVGITALNFDSASDLARRYDVRAFDNVDDLLDAVDIVDLCVPTDLHRDMTLQAAAAGRHVICEKPMALDIETAQEMIDACDRAGVRLFVAMVVRFFPQYRRARDAVLAGTIGDLGVVRLRRVSYPPRGEGDWFSDEGRSGGMVSDLLVHDLDFARWLGGPVERIYGRSVRNRHPQAPVDYALITMRFASGALAHIEGGWANPPGTFRTGFDIAGSAGLIEWDSDSSESVRRFLNPHGPQAAARVGLPLTVLEEDPYLTELRHAHHAIVHDEPFEISPQEAHEAVRLALSARVAIRTGRSVNPQEV